MDYPHSKYLSYAALKGLNKVGDVVLPGEPYNNDGFPRFSATGCIYHVDEVLTTTAPEDVKALNMLLATLGFLPAVVTQWLLQLSSLEAHAPGLLGTGLRLVGVALRGVPISLYYSNLTAPSYTGKTVHEVMAYQVHCEPDY